jgi:hypothetical protein
LIEISVLSELAYSAIKNLTFSAAKEDIVVSWLPENVNTGIITNEGESVNTFLFRMILNFILTDILNTNASRILSKNINIVPASDGFFNASLK